MIRLVHSGRLTTSMLRQVLLLALALVAVVPQAVLWTVDDKFMQAVADKFAIRAASFAADIPAPREHTSARERVAMRFKMAAAAPRAPAARCTPTPWHGAQEVLQF